MKVSDTLLEASGDWLLLIRPIEKLVAKAVPILLDQLRRGEVSGGSVDAFDFLVDGKPICRLCKKEYVEYVSPAYDLVCRSGIKHEITSVCIQRA